MVAIRKHVLAAPFPYFGAKSRAADLVWQRFGDVPNYVEPFAGSLAVPLARSTPPRVETVNDLDGMIANFWRAVQQDPDAVATYADWPVNECDLTARHIWLVRQRDSLTERLMADPDYYDAKIAGWWCWGICCWIGSGWCSGQGSWTEKDGRIVQLDVAGGGVPRQRVHLADAGRGVNRGLVHLGNDGAGIGQPIPCRGQKGEGACAEHHQALVDWMKRLCDRLRHVRVCCGDWTRVIGPSVTYKIGPTGVFLDPPYDQNERAELYAHESRVSDAVREWALENGSNRLLRIALCGYEGEHEMPADWECVPWTPGGGYAGQGKRSRGQQNRLRERIRFSPACSRPEPSMFDLVEVWE